MIAKKEIRDERRVVLVTGCSSGLGLALARKLRRETQDRVVITCRKSSLSRLQSEFDDNDRWLVRELDVTNDDQIHSLINEVCVHWGRVDVLINNAGVCFRAVVEHMDVDSELIQLKTNYLGPMSLIRAVLPMMRERKSGHIINISSVSGMVSMPTMASYSASKHALEGASEALWYEARPYGIKVSLVQPGFIHSDSFRNVVLSKKADMSSKLLGPHSEYYDSLAPFIEKLMKWSLATPETVANRILKMMNQERPPLRLAATFDAVVFRLLRRWLPAELFHQTMFMLLPGSKIWGKTKGRHMPRRKGSYLLTEKRT